MIQRAFITYQYQIVEATRPAKDLTYSSFKFVKWRTRLDGLALQMWSLKLLWGQHAMEALWNFCFFWLDLSLALNDCGFGTGHLKTHDADYGSSHGPSAFSNVSKP